MFSLTGTIQTTTRHYTDYASARPIVRKAAKEKQFIVKAEQTISILAFAPQEKELREMYFAVLKEFTCPAVYLARKAGH